jgi:hypothetical protein
MTSAYHCNDGEVMIRGWLDYSLTPMMKTPPVQVYVCPPVNGDGRMMTSVANIPSTFSVLISLKREWHECTRTDSNAYSWCGRNLREIF